MLWKFYVVMLNKKLCLFLLIFLSNFNQVFGADEGYFNTQNGSEYLGFANMNKEFKINSLMSSAIVNDYKATEIFITSGANVNEVNIANVSALHLAARNYAFESAQVLIKNGATVNAIDLEGWTPLMRASLNGDKKIMELLIANGANIWLQNRFGETALLHTAMADCYECGKLILEKTQEKTPLVKSQVRKSLYIARKKFNKEFIDLLTQYSSTGTVMTITTPEEVIDTKTNPNAENQVVTVEENITRIIYKFLGKSVTASELAEINKNVTINKEKIEHPKKKFKKLTPVVTEEKTKVENNIIQEKTVNKVEETQEPVKKTEEINNNTVLKEEDKKVTTTVVEQETKAENITEQKNTEPTKTVTEKKVDTSTIKNKKAVKKATTNTPKVSAIKQKETAKVETTTEKKFVLQVGQSPKLVEKTNTIEEKKPQVIQKKMKLQTIETGNTVISDETTTEKNKIIEKSKNIKPVAKPTIEEENKTEEETSGTVYTLQSDENILNK